MMIESCEDPSLAAVSAVDRFDPARVAELGVDDELAALLTAIVRYPGDASVPELDALRHRRRVRRGVVVGVATVLTLAGGGVAAASFHSAHTGERAEDPRITDHSEWLDTSGDDFPGIAKGLAVGIPFAPGDGPDTYIGVSLPTTGQVSTDGVRTWLATDAMCGWEGYWLQEHDAGDATGAQSAADAMQKLVAGGLLNPDPAASVGLADELDAVVAAAEAGQPGPIEAEWTPNCAELPQPWAGK